MNQNRRDLIGRALESLRGQTLPVWATVVVDNASTDDSLEVASKAAGGMPVEIVRLGENTGSAGGFAAGAERASALGASHVMMLDSDVVLDRGCLEAMLSTMDHRPDVGIVGPKVYHWASGSILQEFGGWIDWEEADLKRSHWRYDEAVSGPVTSDQRVDYVPACCLLAKRGVFERVGGFDPTWFLYWDDIEWCTRARADGFGICAAAGARVQHYGGGANKRSLVPVYYGWRNRTAFFVLHSPAERRLRAWEAVLGDFLLARFTCTKFGLHRTAAMMTRAVDDALSGVRGRSRFEGVDCSLDPSGGVVGDHLQEERVRHVVGSATAELAARTGLFLVDRFGKKSSATQAYAWRLEFESGRQAQLLELCARASAMAVKKTEREACAKDELGSRPAVREAVRCATSMPNDRGSDR
ncbi:glycosyltransferase [Congregicoccus parvus]|uniref:glycosyltransferase n=1 Tax=Congregicoccus parvus TaxID=3081749 RepID=UPI003FA5FBF7